MSNRRSANGKDKAAWNSSRPPIIAITREITKALAIG
jgi:hypothetical protein